MEIPIPKPNTEVTDETKVIIFFPNYSKTQIWKVKTLKNLPYFRAFFERNWTESVERDQKNRFIIELETKPEIFLRLLDYARFRDKTDEMEQMADYFGVTLPVDHYHAKSRNQAIEMPKEFYKTLCFTRESQVIEVDLGDIHHANEIFKVNIYSSGSMKVVRSPLTFYIDDERVESKLYDEVHKSPFISVLNARLRTMGFIGKLTAKLDFSNIPEDVKAPKFDLYIRYV